MANNAVDTNLAMSLLAEAVKAAKEKGKAAVGEQLGYSRALISRVLSQTDPLQISEKLAQRVIDVYHVIPTCPATGEEQPRSECLRLSNGSAPMHNPMAMRIWKTCQNCAHKPTKGDSK